MKKLLLTLAVTAAGAGLAYAQDVTFDFNSANVSVNAEAEGKIVVNGTTSGANVQPITTAVYQGVTMSFDVNGGSTKPAWYSGTGDIRTYAKNKITITAPEGKTVDKVTFTFTSGWGSTNYNGLELTSGTLDPACDADNKPTNGMTLTWNKTSDVNEVTFTVPAAKSFNTANPQFRYIKAIVTLGNGGGGPVAPSAPEISGTATFYGETSTVTMTAATGADIYYTMATTGSPADPTTSSFKYEGEIVINATTTFKAIAVKDGLTSPVATATFTKGTTMNVNSIEAFLDQNNDEVCTFTNPVTVIGIYSKRYLFVEDATGSLQIFDGSSALDRPYQMGQTISGFTVKRGVYNGTPQGVAAGFDATFPASASGTAHFIAPTKIEATQEAVQANLNKYVYFTGAISKTGTNFFMNAVQLYDRFSLKTITDDEVGMTKDVSGFAVMFNTTPELFYTAIGAPNTLGANTTDMDIQPIYGANGYIVAPADAIIFNIAGMRVANANLAAGIYMVRHNGTTTKVLVK